MTNTQRARELAQWICLPGPTAEVTIRIKTALDAAWRDGVEAAARECDNEIADRNYDVGWSVAEACAQRIRALLPPDPVTAPGHTDLMVAPDEGAAPDAVGALARLFAHGWQNAHLDFDKAHKLGLLTRVGVGRYTISDMGSAALALARRGDGG